MLQEIRQRSLIENWFLIPGNHDPRKMYSGFDLGKIKIVKKIKARVGDKVFLIVHGHQFDVLLHQHPLRIKILNALYWMVRFFEFLDIKRRFYHRFVYNGPTWKGFAEDIAKRALKRGKKKKCDVVICGHTHKARIDERKGVMHYNGGSLTESVCTMITISHDGAVTIHKFSDQGEYLGVLDLTA